jgi:hypothetical protein
VGESLAAVWFIMEEFFWNRIEKKRLIDILDD